jgi:hypothetical protein
MTEKLLSQEPVGAGIESSSPPRVFESGKTHFASTTALVTSISTVLALDGLRN